MKASFVRPVWILALAALLIAGFAHQSGLAGSERAGGTHGEFEVMTLRPIQNAGLLCEAVQNSLSPDAQYVAIRSANLSTFKVEPGRHSRLFQLQSVGCHANADRSRCTRNVIADGNPAAFVWSPDSKALAVLTDRPSLIEMNMALAFSGNRQTVPSQIVPYNRDATVVPIGDWGAVLESKLLTEKFGSALAGADLRSRNPWRNGFVYSVAISPDGHWAKLALARRNSVAMTWARPETGPRPVPVIGWPYLNDSMVLPVPGTTDRVRIVGTGIDLELGGTEAPAQSFARAAERPVRYASPILDEGTGQLVGWHTGRQVVEWGGADRDFPARVVQALADIPNGEMLHITVRDGGRLAAIAVRLPLVGIDTLVLNAQAASSPVRMPQCRAAPPPDGQPRPSVSVEDFAWSDSGTTLHGRWYRGEGPRRGAILWLAGGPYTTFLKGGSDSVVQPWIARGYDVVTFDMSGGRSADIRRMTALQGNTVQILDQETSALAAFLKQLRESGTYRLMGAVHASFSGVYWPDLGRLAGSSVDFCVAQQPFRTTLRPRDWSVATPSEQREYELTFVGTFGEDWAERPDGLTAWMKARTEVEWPRVPCLLVQGARDPVSLPEHFPVSATPTVERLVLPGVGHGIMLGTPTIWPRVVAFLEPFEE